MTKHEERMALRNHPSIHYNCAQSVAIPFAEEMGITREQACAIAANFGGGMGCGSVCGAVAGALMVLGGMGQPAGKRQELMAQFRMVNGDLNCAALLKAAAERGEERRTHCDRMIDQCVDYLCRLTGKE